jgi:hypothetical protein
MGGLQMTLWELILILIAGAGAMWMVEDKIDKRMREREKRLYERISYLEQQVQKLESGMYGLENPLSLTNGVLDTWRKALRVPS